MSNIDLLKVAPRVAPTSSLARDAVLREVDAAIASGEIVTLSAEESRRFLHALDTPFQPNARLAKAMAQAAQLETLTER